MVIWPEPEVMEITVTLYKVYVVSTCTVHPALLLLMMLFVLQGPKDKSYENKEWEFAVIDVRKQ